MTFLPIVARELRVAARKRSTFWVRVAAATTAVFLGCAFLGLAVLTFGVRTAGFGSALFATLTWLSVAAVLSAGVFFTSDCLSEEKREGTIGFLFLTDLKGYDVVLGKLLATSLRGFYAFIAVFPVLATTLLMGGVTGAQFWKTTLALVNALFLSLATGMLVSAISRDSQKALVGTLVAVVLLSVGGPIIDSIISELKQTPFGPALSLASPVYVFAIAGAWGPSAFWLGLLVNQMIAWSALGLTSLLLPQAWQERGRRSHLKRTWIYWWKFGGEKRRAALRRKLLGHNPMLWLASRERWQAVAVWGVCLLTAAGVGATLVTSHDIKVWLTWNYLGGVVTLVLYLMVASQACRFFVNAKRSGVLELLLSTPLTAVQIVHGQGRALLRMFAVPLGLYLAMQLFASVLAQQAFKDVAAGVPATPIPFPGTNAVQTNATTLLVTTNVVVAPPAPATVSAQAGNDGPGWFITAIICVGGAVVVGANLVALWWFGMWMGLTSRTANMATLKTIVFVQIIPWFVIMFAGWMVVHTVLLSIVVTTGSPRAMITWTPLLGSAFATLLAAGKDVGFVIFARRRLYGQLRFRAAEIGNYAPPLITPHPAATVSSSSLAGAPKL